MPGSTSTVSLFSERLVSVIAVTVPVRQDGAHVEVTREGGDEPLPHEARRVAGIVAAHAAQPFSRAPGKNS
jgi:hypothetical protein